MRNSCAFNNPKHTGSAWLPQHTSNKTIRTRTYKWKLNFILFRILYLRTSPRQKPKCPVYAECVHIAVCTICSMVSDILCPLQYITTSCVRRYLFLCIVQTRARAPARQTKESQTGQRDFDIEDEISQRLFSFEKYFVFLRYQRSAREDQRNASIKISALDKGNECARSSATSNYCRIVLRCQKFWILHSRPLLTVRIR